MSETMPYLPESEFAAPPGEMSGEGSARNESAELLGLGAAEGEPKTSRIPSGLILMAVVLVVAVSALYVMRLGGTSRTEQDAGAATAEAKIKQALAALMGGDAKAEDALPDDQKLPDTSEVIARFADDPTDKQVRVDQLKKNPFQMRRPKPAEVQTPVQQVSHEQKQRELRMRQLRQEAQSYVLQTVMSGRTPMAVVSGKVVKEGDALGHFRVASIESLAVMLTAEGNTYKLKLNPVSQSHD